MTAFQASQNLNVAIQHSLNPKYAIYVDGALLKDSSGSWPSVKNPNFSEQQILANISVEGITWVVRVLDPEGSIARKMSMSAKWEMAKLQDGKPSGVRIQCSAIQIGPNEGSNGWKILLQQQVIQ